MTMLTSLKDQILLQTVVVECCDRSIDSIRLIAVSFLSSKKLTPKITAAKERIYGKRLR